VLDVEGVTPLSGSDLLVDARIEDDGAGVDSDPPLERLVAVADEEEAVVEARERGTTGDRVELTMAGESVLFPLIELGARIRSLSTSGGRTRTTAEVPPGTEVRAVVERVEATVPSVRLVARREREDDGGRAALASSPEVTDRQREALEIAYGAGYFEWPREATAEDVAVEMDITSPTLQQHLRTAHRKLVGSYVEDDESRQREDEPDTE